jgi:hypothetical protein
MESNGIQWNPMESNGIQWNPIPFLGIGIENSELFNDYLKYKLICTMDNICSDDVNLYPT